MNLISVINYKGEKILKIGINIQREFKEVDIQDRIGVSNYDQNFGEVFSKPKIK